MSNNNIFTTPTPTPALMHAHAPRPNVGTCKQKGNWPNTGMISKCVDCVSNYDSQGNPQFYCGGKCMSEFNSNHVCSTMSLVAENLDQCEKPCVQTSAPSLGAKSSLTKTKTKTTKETYVYSTNVNNINLSDDVKTIYDDYSPALYNFSSKAFNGLAGV